IAYLFPLYLYPYSYHHPVRNNRNLFTPLTPSSSSLPDRQSNIDPRLLRLLGEMRGFGPGPTVEEVFYYIYAVLFSRVYRESYAEGLKIDFPRIPFTSDHDVFTRMGRLGERLAGLHLMKSPELDRTDSRFEVSGNNMVKKIYYDSSSERVFINEWQYFSNVSPELWEYKLGGYPVLRKWLSLHRGKNIFGAEDILNFIKLVRMLQLTVRCQDEIDELYPEVEKNLLHCPPDFFPASSF
ncbi:MAG: DNA methyltransferase, partial [bacterium]|nr:DNA methyltransferase [bacterium]